MTLKEGPHIIQELLAPENELEAQVTAMPEFQDGLFWGKPRYGHPEGQVILHIREVLDNVEQLYGLDTDTRLRLRLATLVHDTFKYKEYELASKEGNRRPEYHHAHLAAEYLAQFVEDEGLVKVVRWHDEAFYCWRLLHRGQVAAHQARWAAFVDLMGNDMQLYYLFFKCDTSTGDKDMNSLLWFEENAVGIQLVDWVMQD